MNNYVPSEAELRAMELEGVDTLDDDNSKNCDGCVWDVYGDCGQGMEYGKGGPCFDDGC